MSKFSIIGPFIILTSVQSHAWEIGPIKGDDPRIIVDAVEGVKKVGKEVSNGAKDVVNSVGNATGLTDVIESNTKTLSDLGRANACHLTMCLSELLRAEQLASAERDSKDEYERVKAELVKSYHNINRETQRQMLENSKSLAQDRMNLLTDSSKLVERAIENIRAVQKTIVVEKEYRTKLKLHNIERRPLEKREMITISQKFENTQKQNIKAALDQLNKDIEAISILSGRSHAMLMAEFIRIIDIGAIEDLAKHAELRVAQLLDERSLLIKKIMEADADFKNADQTLKTGKY